MPADTDDLADRLEALAEELADLAIDRLKASVAAKASARPVDEKRITQARRAVEKAVHLLRTIDRHGAADDDET